MRLAVPTDLSALLSTGLLRSVGSLGIKVATAGLTYITYVVLSRTQTESEYGHFAFGLALATVLAILAGMGQSTAVLRLWPQLRAKGENNDAEAVVAAGSAITIGASLILAGLLCVLAVASIPFLPPRETINHFIGAAFLILPMALAEYNSSVLRAQGSLWTALLPRDIVWRLALRSRRADPLGRPSYRRTGPADERRAQAKLRHLAACRAGKNPLAALGQPQQLAAAWRPDRNFYAQCRRHSRRFDARS
jgi:hypothetical protein